MTANIEKRSRRSTGTVQDKPIETSKTMRRPRRERSPSSLTHDIPQDELTPKVQSFMTKVMGELDRLKAELEAAHQKVNLLENIADEDPLVPVLNRRGFIRELERAIAYSKRYQTPLSVLYIDMDGFKAINDTYGHAAGDAALRHIGVFLMDFVRKSDIVGRLGGDEFAIVLQQADQDAAQLKSDQLSQEIKTNPCLFEGHSIPLCLSAGVTQMQNTDDVEQLMERADKAMYELRAHMRGRRLSPVRQ